MESYSEVESLEERRALVTCKKAVNLMLDFLEGNVTSETRQGLMKHFKDCPPCLQFVETYKGTTALCKSALLKKAPAELSDRLMSYLRQQTKSPSPKDP